MVRMDAWCGPCGVGGLVDIAAARENVLNAVSDM